jgi:alkanesulfonate monooxygenase SsuD/methylene tetrahydromethanopterin reductase-like flavin-dependent oxidoreductase (luciferase family)
MRPLEIGLVLPMGDSFVDGTTVRWREIRELATRAEEIGFDTVWTADELLWRPEGGRPQGWWECVAMTGAVAAAMRGGVRRGGAGSGDDRAVGGRRDRADGRHRSGGGARRADPGSADAIADALLGFHAGGFDHVEVLPWPPTVAALDALAPVLDRLDQA